MKKVAIFLPSLRGGGAERVMVTVAAEMAARGHLVDVVLAKAEGPYIEQLPETVRVIDLNSGRVALALWGLVKYLQKERPFVLLATMRHANLVAILANKIVGIDVRVVVREANTIGVALKEKRNLVESLMPHLMKYIYPYADAVLAVSNGVKVDLIDYSGIPPSIIKVIYNPVVTGDLLTLADKQVEHPWFGNDQPPVVMSAGRLDRQKDFSTLIKAFFLLRKHKMARLVIFGEGEERHKLEQLVKTLGLSGEVAFPGFEINPFRYMKQSSVYVLSSLWEGLPNGLIQALSVGAKVVSTDCPSGPSEILEGGKYGLLVPVNSPDQLAEAMLSALSGQGISSRDERIAYCQRRFGVKQVVTEYCKLMGVN